MLNALRPITVLAFLACGRLAASFAPAQTRDAIRITALGMAPKYDPFTQRWEATEDEDYEGAYGPVGSLIRAGPKPFLIRLFSPDQYEQAVLKYMSNENVGRMEAQGNMDAYFENPNDWAYQKTVERRGGYKRDWATANTDPKQVTLSGIWAGIVVWFFYTLVNDSLAGKYPTQNLFDFL
uniref:Uncharacterized protein n=1 Tax=Pseudictyota dubia TaxID=2749911 RepID=A0A7R9W357_9STRA|mmetsp:Transcript_31306/g.57783  ORF Transcript_31306/g.57783 Transcript_31306/m.57783 type:complete len:180 (+) Transcript_31306:111-650(+)